MYPLCPVLSPDTKNRQVKSALLKLSHWVKPDTETLGSVNGEAKLKFSHLETLIPCVQQKRFEGKQRIVKIPQCLLDLSIESSQ